MGIEALIRIIFEWDDALECEFWVSVKYTLGLCRTSIGIMYAINFFGWVSYDFPFSTTIAMPVCVSFVCVVCGHILLYALLDRAHFGRLVYFLVSNVMWPNVFVWASEVNRVLNLWLDDLLIVSLVD